MHSLPQLDKIRVFQTQTEILDLKEGEKEAQNMGMAFFSVHSKQGSVSDNDLSLFVLLLTSGTWVLAIHIFLQLVLGSPSNPHRVISTGLSDTTTAESCVIPKNCCSSFSNPWIINKDLKRLLAPSSDYFKPAIQLSQWYCWGLGINPRKIIFGISDRKL